MIFIVTIMLDSNCFLGERYLFCTKQLDFFMEQLFVILSVVRGNLSPRVLAESKGTVAFRLVPLRGEVSESVPRPQTVSRKA